jgi:ubiquinone/menaquinone biosynthesis C-methylase UbiE/DNA-binding transcriptional ArsR family regulator
MTIEPIMRALGDLTRLRIMRLIATMELAVGELAHALGQSQPRVSRHVAILCDAGLVERRREGSWAFLREAATGGERVRRAVAELLAAAEEEDPSFARVCAEDRRHLAAIRDARAKNAADYFARHADDWDTLRVLLAPAEAVEDGLVAALGERDLGTLLDVGTGTGRIAELLEPRAARVTGVDKSPEMLRLARARLQALPAGRVELVQADFAALPFADDSFDTVVFHQVLHYAQAPEYALAEAARVCRDAGRVAIVDFAPHGREELRERHAHVRLGFSDSQVRGLLEAAGFVPGPSQMLPGPELTVMIWTGERERSPVARLAPRRREARS